MATQNYLETLEGYEVQKIMDGQLIHGTRKRCQIIPCWMLLCKDQNQKNPRAWRQVDNEYVIFPIIPDGVGAPAEKILRDCKNHKIEFDETSFYHEAYQATMPAVDFLKKLERYDYKEPLCRARDLILEAVEENASPTAPITANKRRFLYVTYSKYGAMWILDFDDDAWRPAIKVAKDLGERREIGYVDAVQLLDDCMTMSESAIDEVFSTLDPTYVDCLNQGNCIYPGKRHHDAWQLYYGIQGVDIIPTIVTLNGAIQHVGYDFAGSLYPDGGTLSYADLGSFQSAYKAVRTGHGNFVIQHVMKMSPFLQKR